MSGTKIISIIIDLGTSLVSLSTRNLCKTVCTFGSRGQRIRRDWLIFALPLKSCHIHLLSQAHSESLLPSYLEQPVPWSCGWAGETEIIWACITSCVFARSVVCVIWFRWKPSVWITLGYGFPVLCSPHCYPAHTCPYPGELWFTMALLL